MQPIGEAFRQLWPAARVTHLLEDSLSADLAAEGRLTERMFERFVALARYAHGAGADAILFTCSAFGPAIEAAAAAVPIPVLKPNEAMLEEALTAGNRIGLLATFEPSIPALRAELEQMARKSSIALEITTRVVPAALKALHAGCAADLITRGWRTSIERILVRDAPTAITAVYEAADIEPPTGPTAFVEGYNAARPRHAHGTHRYSAADFGLDENELRERFAFLDSSVH